MIETQQGLQGMTFPQTTHLVDIDGELQYFTDCGTPVSP